MDLITKVRNFMLKVNVYFLLSSKRPFYAMPFLLGKEAKYLNGKSSPLNKAEGPGKYLLGNFDIKFYHGKIML